MLIEILKIGTAFGVFVVAHPTFEEVYVLPAGRAGVGEQLVGI
jgi:hypothetical protein